MKDGGKTHRAGGGLAHQARLGGLCVPRTGEGRLHRDQRLHGGARSAKTKFVYRDELWTGADLIGLGVASFSHIAGTHFQNLTEFSQYLDAIERGDLPISRAMATTEEERMIRELILQLKLGRVSRSYFRDKFGIDLAQRFAQQFDDLRLKGLLVDEGDWLVLSREALLKVDTLLHAFFLPQHKHARYT